jgi:chromosome partitioning protein
MRVWAIANQKGGVGKTSSVVSLAGILSQQKKRVLMVDLDPQGSLTSYFRYNPDELEHSIYDLFMYKGDVPEGLPGQLVLNTNQTGLDLLPSSTALATLERNISSQGGMGLVISKALAQLWDDYDYVLLDTPPLLGVLLINALAACERLVLPVQTEFMAIKGLERMVNTIQMVMKSRKQAVNYLVVPTMFDRRTQASTKSLRMLNAQYPDNIWQSAIPVDTKLRDASREGVPISTYDKDSRATRAYTALLKNLIQQEVVA